MTPRQPRVDWDTARAFYVSLGPVDRSYARVAAEFRVSDVTVRKWAKRQDWPGVAAAADKEASDAAHAQAVKTRTERVSVALRFVDGYLDEAAAKLTARQMDVKASDVPHLMKLAELLLGEPTDRIAVAQLEPLLDAYDQALDRLREMAPDKEAADSVIGSLDEQLLALAAASRTKALA